MIKLDATHIHLPALVLPELFAPMELAQDSYFSRFGGPVELRFENWPAAAPRPQQVIRLDTNASVSRSVGLTGFVPFAYPFQISGCRMKYAMTGANRAKLLELHGDATAKDFPYEHYPLMFPTAPLRFAKPQPIDWDEIDADDEGYPMTWQDTRPEAGQALIIVPPNDRYGVSLWGDGDLEQVQLIFRIDLAARTVEAWNECG